MPILILARSVKKLLRGVLLLSSKFKMALPIHAGINISLTSIHIGSAGIHSAGLYRIETIELKLASLTLPRMG
jgi:hypothetical protein